MRKRKNISNNDKLHTKSIEENSVHSDSDSSSESSVEEPKNPLKYCRTFLNIFPTKSDTNKKSFGIQQHLNAVVWHPDTGPPTQYTFDKILADYNKGNIQYFTTLLPLLETVYYHKKDATLVGYGPRGTGKSTTLGFYEGFFNARNALRDSLSYFYTKVEELKNTETTMYFLLTLFKTEKFTYHVLKYV